MQISYLNALIKILDDLREKNTLLLLDKYYTETPFKMDKECKDLEAYLKEYFSKNIKIIYSQESLKDVEGQTFDLIINNHFSTKYSNQVDFINEILKNIIVSGFFLNILPFIGFVNYNCQTFNPAIFEKLNSNENFLFKYFSLIDNYGDQLVIHNNFLSKFFLQTTEKKNQNHIDEVYRKTIFSMKDTSILCLSEILKLDPLKKTHFLPRRLPHHLSGHGFKSWVDDGALKTILENIKVKSFLDIGCGPGEMVHHAEKYGLEALGIDGDDSIIRKSENSFIIHDYCKNPYIPPKDYDLGWSVEFLEHVDKKFENNYFETFKKCKYVFVTHAPKNARGYNHVNLQDSLYWIELFKKNNFEYLENLTQLIRRSSTIEKDFIRKYGLFFKNRLRNSI